VVQLYAVVESYFAALKDAREEGQGMVEYALIIALVSVVAIVILGTLGTNIVAKLTEAATALT
jgi:pilus assembly protein Flp/PilA